MNKIKVLIPVRGGSKGLKGKHLQIVNNKPLIFWTLDQFIEELGECIEIYISTDCPKISELCLSKYDVKILERPSYLALDETSTEDVLKTIAQSWNNTLNQDELVIYASACEINRKKGLLGEALDFYKKNNIDSFMYGEKSHKHIWTNSNDEQKLLCNWMESYLPRQSSGSNYLIEHTGLILITKLKYWLMGNRFGGKIFVKELDHLYRHVDIHHRIDLKIASAILS